MMDFNKLTGISDIPPRADKSAVAAINRALQGAGVCCYIPLLSTTEGGRLVACGGIQHVSRGERAWQVRSMISQ